MAAQLRRFSGVFLGLLVVDWVMGALCAKHVLPLWTLALVNFPAGLPHVALESTWAGNHYEWNGTAVGEGWGLLTFAAMVIVQAAIYTAVPFLWRRARRSVAPVAS